MVRRGAAATAAPAFARDGRAVRVDGGLGLQEIQRARLLASAVGAIEERGYAQTTVAHITSRARVSRRTFYELFKNREQCLVAVLDDAIVGVEGELAQRQLHGLPWRERVRAGLWEILCLLDREPGLAKVCVVEALRGGPVVLERRERVLARLAATLEEGRHAGPRAAQCAPLTAEGLVGAAFAIVYARLLHGPREPLSGLLGELMSLIALPYMGPAAARRELRRELPPAALTERQPASAPARGEQDPLRELPMRLTYRTTRVLACIAGRPYVNNREVATDAGVSDQGQISKLLARLERLGLVVNSSDGHAKGEPNAWSLTPLGHDVAHRLALGGEHREGAASARGGDQRELAA
jgi:AcrR family transcriptional regulator/DNA-binding MarR family transcriptional regulator